VPKNHLPVRAGGSQEVIPGAEGHVQDRLLMLLQLVDRPPGGQIPDPDPPVLAARGKEFAVPAKGYRVHPASILGKGKCELGFAGVPDADGAVLPGGGKFLASGAKGKAGDFAGVAAEGVDRALLLQVPDGNGVSRPCGSQQPAVGAEGHATPAR